MDVSYCTRSVSLSSACISILSAIRTLRIENRSHFSADFLKPTWPHLFLFLRILRCLFDYPDGYRPPRTGKLKCG